MNQSAHHYANQTRLINQIKRVLNEAKATDITVLDVRQKCNFTHWLVIASATSSRHAKALAQRLELNQKKANNRPLSVEGMAVSEWILLDFFEVVVHIMLADVRQRYALEKLWGLAITTQQDAFKQA